MPLLMIYFDDHDDDYEKLNKSDKQYLFFITIFTSYASASQLLEFISLFLNIKNNLN